MNYEHKIEPTLLVKVNQGLPMTAVEYGRFALQSFEMMKDLWARVEETEKQINDLKVSLHGSRLDPPAEVVDSTTKLRSKPKQRDDSASTGAL